MLKMRPLLHGERQMSDTYGYFARTYRPELKAAGTHFFCQGCLIHKPTEDKSTDLRYCHGCYDFLIEEAMILDIRGNNKGRSRWIPIDNTAPEKCAKTPKEKHTLETPHTTVFAQPDGENIKPGANSGGRPAKDLPVEKIQDLFAQGDSVTEILRQLEIEGITVSRRTVYNVLAGQRVMV